MSELQTYLLIAFGGALGAPARYLVGACVKNAATGSFPWGTFAVNVSGSLLLGFIMPLLAARLLPPPMRPLIAVGFIGAYTTFSTFEYETAQLASSWQAMANLAGSVVAGYAAIWIGTRLADLIIKPGHGG